MISDEPNFFGWLNVRYVNWVNRIVDLKIRPMRFIAGPDDRHTDAKILMEVEVIIKLNGNYHGEVWQLDPSRILDWNVPQPTPEPWDGKIPAAVDRLLKDWAD